MQRLVLVAVAVFCLFSSLNLVSGCANGQFFEQLVFGTGESGSEPGEFNSPYEVAFHSGLDMVLVVDQGNGRVQYFQSNGNMQGYFGFPGTGDGEFDTPTGIAVDPLGRVYVVDSGNNMVQRFIFNNATNEFDFDLLWGQITSGTEPGYFNTPQGVAIASNGNVLVADTFNTRIQEFTPNGTFVSQWDEFDGTTFQYPFGVTVDPRNGNIIVVDSGNNLVVVFDESHNFIRMFGGSIFLNLPSFATVDPNNGYVFVTDTDAIHVFTDAGIFLTRFNTSGGSTGIEMIPGDPLGRFVVSLISQGRVVLLDVCVNGRECTSADSCISGFCVDGACCVASQCSTCKSCNMAPTPGVCTTVPVGTDPNSDCNGECFACSADATCVLLDPVDQPCSLCEACNSDGSCVPAAQGSDPKNDCAECQTCDGAGACVNAANGAECGAGDCYRCDGSGTCEAVPNGEDPRNDCGACQVCDGSGSCRAASQGSDPKNDCPEGYVCLNPTQCIKEESDDGIRLRPFFL